MLNPDVWLTLDNGARVHPSALIAPWVSLGAGCIVHPYAVVGRLPDLSPALARQPERVERLSIGRDAVIGCHAVIYGGVDIGADCLVGDHALVREGAVIGDRCVVGCHVSISYDCRIADDCRFQNGAVFHGICGPGCFFGVGVVCSSDRHVDLVDYRHAGAVLPVFGKRVMVGSGANILAGITVGDDAVIAAGAVATKDVAAGDMIFGPAAIPRRLFRGVHA